MMTLDDKLDLLLEDMAGMKSDMADMKSDIVGLKSDMAGVKSDMAGMATKADIADMVTKADIADMVSKADIADMATKADIADMVTKADIADMATTTDVKIVFDELMKSERWQVKLESNIKAIESNVRTLIIQADNTAQLFKLNEKLDIRVTALEKKIS